MKSKSFTVSLAVAVILFFSSCGRNTLVKMTSKNTDKYNVIVWEDREYIPFCVVTKKECGNQIGTMVGDSDDRIYEFKNYSSYEWIISFPKYEGGGMLYREIGVTDIPDGFISEYEWNN